MAGIFQLSDGRFIALSALHIRRIPHVSLFGDKTVSVENNALLVEDNKREMASLLSQIYQLYSEKNSRGYNSMLAAIELLWATEKVERQPYKASIELYVIVRAVEKEKNDAVRSCDTIANFCRSSLSLQWYDFEECSVTEFAGVLSRIDTSAALAIVKEERMEMLPFRQFPQCYVFDRFTHNLNDFRKLVGTLINYPGCVVSMQLMPTKYSDECEKSLLQISQLLNTMASGFQDNVAAKTDIITAKRPAALYSYYAQERTRPLYNFNLTVTGNTEAVTALCSRVAGMLNEGVEPDLRANTVFLKLPVDRMYASVDTQLFGMPWFVASLVRERLRRLDIHKDLRNLSNTISIDEATSFFSLPIANERIGAGLRVNETGMKSHTYADGLINSGDISVGTLKVSPEDTIGICLSDLAKHMLVVGTPGSGKTTFSVGLLHRLWCEHKIPFLVIEPAKNEYRALIKAIPELQIFTPGKNEVSPFVFNPFVPPRNVKLLAYKSVLKTAFQAGVSMTTPLDKIFEETVDNCYSDHHWLESYTIDDGGKVFNIRDFIKGFEDTFENIGYTGDSKNIGRAGLIRLKGLEKLFDNYFSIPISDILSKPTVIELAAIENSDEKALYIALLLLNVMSYVNANYVGEGGLKNFILLEEAHVLLDVDSSRQEGAANPAAIAQGLVKRMLAEIRSYGVGLAVADQSPRKVGRDIVALTDIKVAFRLVENEDRQLIAESTGMDENQIKRLSKLKPGEAFLFFNKLESPEEIITPDYRLENKIDISLSDCSIAELSTYWNDKQTYLRPYPECSFPRCCQHGCDYQRRILAREISNRITKKKVSFKDKSDEPVHNMIKNLSKLIKSELGNGCYTHELEQCIKLHVLRWVKYNTKVRYSFESVKKTLEK